MASPNELLVAGLPIGEHVAWDGDVLVARSEHAIERLTRPHLSVSTAKTFDRCAAGFVADRVLSGGFDLMGAAEIGSAAHTVMERLLQMPAVRRDDTHAARLLVELAKEDPAPGDVDYAKHLGTDPIKYAQWVSAVTAAYIGLFSIEDPREVDVVATEMEISGIKLAGVPFKGFIDRVDRVDLRGEKVLRVIDYKTGKPKLKKPQAGFDDTHGDQIKIYVEACVEMLGERPKVGALYYTGAGGGARRVAVSRAETKKTLDWLASVWGTFVLAMDDGRYRTNATPLCGWCPLVNSCPTSSAAGRTDRTGSAPTAVELGIPQLRAGDGPELHEPPTFVDEDLPDEWRSDMTATTEAPASQAWAEGRPYDGPLIQTANGPHPNLASYAASTSYGLVALAVEVLAEARQPLNRTNISAMANTLSTLHRKAQRKVTGHDLVDAGAATRMSGALRSALEVTPVPFGQTLATWNEWANIIVRRTVAIADTANDLLLNGPDTNYPWSVFASDDAPADSDPFDEPVGAAN